MKKLFIKHIKINIFIILFILIANICQTLAVLSLSNLLNSVINGDFKSLFQLFFIIFGLWIIYYICEFIYKTLEIKCIEKMNNDLRLDITESIISMNLKEFNSREIGNYISWYTNDIIEIENSVFKSIYSIIYKVSSLVLVLYALFKINYILALTLIISSVILMISPKIFSQKVSNLSIEQSQQQEKFTKNSKDILCGFEVMKIYNSLNLFNEKIEELSSDLESNRYKLYLTKNKSNFFIGIINITAQLSCIFIAAFLAYIGKVEYGVMLATGGLSRACFNSLCMMSTDIVSLIGGTKVLKKLNSIKIREDFKANLINFDEFKCELQVKNLSYSYDKLKVLDNINLIFEKGKKYAVIGPSGCGKSTFLKILIGHIYDFEGNIFIDGNDIKDYDIKSIYNNFAYIDQNVYLFNTSVENNISVFKDKYGKNEIKKALDASALSEFFTEENLSYTVGENGKNLSGGQKQRVAIARALLNKKKIIIMDEGTSALDKKNSYIVEEQLLKNPDITLILVSHNLNEKLIHLFDKIYNFDEINHVNKSIT